MDSYILPSYFSFENSRNLFAFEMKNSKNFFDITFFFPPPFIIFFFSFKKIYILINAFFILLL